MQGISEDAKKELNWKGFSQNTAGCEKFRFLPALTNWLS